MDDRMLSSIEVCELLGIKPATLDDWAYRERGPRYYKVGRLRRYRQSDVETYLESVAVG